MKFGYILLASVLLTQSAFAKKSKASEIPECLENKDGGVDPAFINIGKIAKELSKCDDKMDPREKAFLYLQNLKGFTSDLSQRISTKNSDFTESKLAQGFKPEQLKVLVKNTGLIKGKTFKDVLFEAGGKIPNAEIKSALKVVQFLDKNILDGESEPSQPTEFTTLNEQFNEMEKYRNDIRKNAHELSVRLDKIMKSYDAPDGASAKSLNSKDKEILRATICRFIPVQDRNKKQDDNFWTLCSAAHGGQELNHERGTLSCKDVDAIDVDNHEKEYLKVEAAYAKSIALSVPMLDDEGLMTEGTPARFSIKLNWTGQKNYVDQFKEAEISFQSPGGTKLLCTMLKGPEFSKYWSEKNGKKVLSDSLTIKDVNLPTMLHLHSSNKGGALTDRRYQLDQYGRVQRFRANNRPSEGRSGEDYLKESKIDVTKWPVTKIVKNECDE